MKPLHPNIQLPGDRMAESIRQPNGMNGFSELTARAPIGTWLSSLQSSLMMTTVPSGTTTNPTGPCVMAFTSWLRKARDRNGTDGEMPTMSMKRCEGSLTPGLKVTDWYAKQKAGIKEAPASQIHRALRTFQMPQHICEPWQWDPVNQKSTHCPSAGRRHRLPKISPYLIGRELA